jgi:RNA polymerase sigma factor (sigma-70 family)
MDDDEDAIRLLYQTSFRRLVGQLYAVTGDLAEAEDVVQEAFVRAVSRPREFTGVVDPQAWLRTVALNVARNRFRRRWVFDRLFRAGRLGSVDVVPEMTPDRLDLVTALRALPYRVRAALVLYHLVDLPIDDVAVALGARPNTVKSWLARGRAALAKELGDWEAIPRA